MTAPTNLEAGLPAASRGLPPRRRTHGRAAAVRCQICRAKTTPGLDLGHQPVGDLLLSTADLNRPETLYPMRLHHCPDCGLTQLGFTVSPRIVYRNFPFLSGTTQTATRHLQALAGNLVARLGLGPKSFAVDIGSNDGTLLKGYVPHGVRFLGVDPAGDPVRIANAAGIPTLHAFFDAETAEKIREEQGPADAISAAGCFAHIADLSGLMTGVRRLLAPRGIFATDSQYWLDTAQRLHYDNVFHQHLRYYSLRPLERLFSQYEMEIFDVERSEVYGGSIAVFAGHRGTHPVSRRVRELQAVESAAGLYENEFHERFRIAVEKKKRTLFDAVYRHVSGGRRVVGVGAPAKASTVCNACRLGPEMVSYITEVNPLRIGKHLPGVHIPIVGEERMFDDSPPPDAAVLFSWNYADEIVPKLRQRGFTGDVILP
ncbi:MAG: class I SAM-dependent methyltransferase [Acidobacteriota bacterium]|nr:class I SAM-dependent methyltransferase [Acidobacteriota bacterium]